MSWLWFTAKVSRPSGVVTPSGDVEIVTTPSPAVASISPSTSHATVTFTG
ncbi:hypothetical protein EV567_4430 [Streptomyces sp. BK239]|nr:hypothetical protein EV567_4430 [Streptomyces sp. BK239]